MSSSSVNANATPVQPTPAPAPAAPAPDLSAGAPTSAPPDLSNLISPGPQAQPNYQTAALGSATAAAAGVKSAIDQYNKDRAVSTVPVPGPHARLMSMISGLATGLGAFGTAIATHGREGGVEEVTRVQGEEQRQKLEAQAARDARKNQTLQQDLMNASNQMTLMSMYKNLSSMPDEMTLNHLRVSEAQQAIETGKQVLGRGSVELQQAYEQTGIVPQGYVANSDGMLVSADKAGTPVISGVPTGSAFVNAPVGTVAPGVVSGGVVSPPVALTSPVYGRTNNRLVNVEKMLGADDPAVVDARQIWNDPTKNISEKIQAINQAEVKAGGQEKVFAFQKEREAADPLYKLETDPNELTGDKAPAAIALLSSKLNDPQLPPDQKPRVQRLLSMAQNAQKNNLAFEAAKERERQAITDGDPKAAGALLQSGLVSPQELISSRKPQFAQRAFDEAIRLGGGVKNPKTGKWEGGTWSAVVAESQYEYAKNPHTQNTLNLLTTMMAPGGSIDIAQKTFNTIPGKIDVKTFNKIVTGGVTQFGGTSTVSFQAAMTSLADEYAQVLQGGAATETTLKQAKDLIQQAYTKTQGAGAFDTIRLDMAARQKGMVRNNPALMAMYPPVASSAPSPAVARPANVSQQAVLMSVPGGQPHWIEPVNVAAARAKGAAEVK